MTTKKNLKITKDVKPTGTGLRTNIPGVFRSHKHHGVGSLALAHLLPFDDRLRSGPHTWSIRPAIGWVRCTWSLESKNTAVSQHQAHLLFLPRINGTICSKVNKQKLTLSNPLLPSKLCPTLGWLAWFLLMGVGGPLEAFSFSGAEIAAEEHNVNSCVSVRYKGSCKAEAGSYLNPSL